MSQTLLEMAKDLVSEQIRMYQLPPEEATALLQTTHDTLRRLCIEEMSGSTSLSPQAPGAGAPPDWQRSISRHAIICLECGDVFRQLSARHLRRHDLDPKSYRAKYGIPRTQSLSSRTASARRRQLARQIRPWEGSRSKRDAAKTAPRSAKKAT